MAPFCWVYNNTRLFISGIRRVVTLSYYYFPYFPSVVLSFGFLKWIQHLYVEHLLLILFSHDLIYLERALVS